MKSIRVTVALLNAVALCGPTPILAANAAPVAARSNASMQVAQAQRPRPRARAPPRAACSRSTSRTPKSSTCCASSAPRAAGTSSAGEDVKGKMSVSLRNVTWEQALDTCWRPRGWRRSSRAASSASCPREQLAKEREAKREPRRPSARPRSRSAPSWPRPRSRKPSWRARRRAQERRPPRRRARGPLQEETVRLSYADPEEVAKTLQGILGIPPRARPAHVSPGARRRVPAVIPEPPFSQLYGRGAQRRARARSCRARRRAGQGHHDPRAQADQLDLHPALRGGPGAHQEADPRAARHPAAPGEDRGADGDPRPQRAGGHRRPVGRRRSAGQAGNTTVVGRGLPAAPRRCPATLPVQGGVLQPDGTSVIVSPTGPGPRATALPLGTPFPVDSQSGLPIGGNLVNLPLQRCCRTRPRIPAAGIAFGIVGTVFNINLALRRWPSRARRARWRGPRSSPSRTTRPRSRSARRFPTPR